MRHERDARRGGGDRRGRGRARGGGGAAAARASTTWSCWSGPTPSASSWRARYDGLRLNTVRRLSGLPAPSDSRPPPARGRRARRSSRYLEQVARARGSTSASGSRCAAVEREAERVEAADVGRAAAAPASWSSRPATTACRRCRTGPGATSFAGELLHARGFRNPDPYRGRDVLVVGAGNTGTRDRDPARRRRCRAGARVGAHAGQHHAADGSSGMPTPVLARVSEGAAGVARGPDGLPDAAHRMGRPVPLRHAPLAVRRRDGAAGAGLGCDARPWLRRGAEEPERLTAGTGRGAVRRAGTWCSPAARRSSPRW